MYSSFYRRTFVIATIAILGWAVSAIIQPLWAPLGWATMLAFLLTPLHEHLSAKLNGRRSVSASILTAATPLFIITPLVFTAIAFGRQLANLVNALRDRSFLPLPELQERLGAYPLVGPAVRWLGETVPVSSEQVKEWIVGSVQTILKSAAAMSSTFALGVLGSLVGFFIMLFLLYFLLRDGRMVVEFLTRLIPMESTAKGRLREYLGDVIRAVVFGSTATAVIQGTLVGIGFAILGLPSPLVFAVLGAVAAFLPVGSAVVLVPAVLYLVFVGRWGAAVFMAVWSVGVGLADNFLRPLLTAQRADVPTLVVFVGAIGGVSTFGIIGLVVGPVLLSFVVALVRFAATEMTEGH